MELIFIFILPLLFILPCIKVENNYVYDNNGNYEEKEKTIVFDSPLNLTTNEVNTMSLYNSYFFLEGESFYVDEDCKDIIDLMEGQQFWVALNYVDLIGDDGNHSFELSLSEIYDFEYNDGKVVLGWDSSHQVEFHFDDHEFYLIATTENDEYLFLVRAGTFWSVIENNFDIDWFTGEGGIYTYYNVPNNYNVINYVDDLSFIGKIKNIFIDFLDFNDSFLLDLFITYTYLWIMFFIAWHFLYTLFDFIVHLVDKERRRE